MRLLKPLRLVSPALLCALAAHAAVYRSLWPSGAAHGYFGWYEPLLGAVSGAVLLALVAVLGIGLTGNRRARALLASLAGGGSPPLIRAYRLALTSLGILVTQETLEASLTSGHVALGAFSGASIPLVVATVALLSAALVGLGRSYERVAKWVVARAERLPARPRVAGPPVRRRSVLLRRPAPLAAGRGLRAPPLLAS